MAENRGVMRVVSAVIASVTLAVTGCAPSTPGAPAAKLQVVATINTWGSIAAQLGGDRIDEISIITNPDTDPHDYEPSPADARTVADSKVFVANGIGYDAWSDKLLGANPDPGRTVISVGDTVGVPDDGNPHQWYSPDSVGKVADAITAAYQHADPTDAAYFDQQHQHFLNQALGQYHALRDDIKAKYGGTPVGASESIFSPLADALKLNLITPPEFLKAISEGTDPAPGDKSTIDNQIASKAIRVYVYNSQNTTPDVQAQVDAARKQNIPVTTVTETLTPAGASFQDWQVGQLHALEDALHVATGN